MKYILIFILFSLPKIIFAQQDLSLKQFVDNWIGKPYRYGGIDEKGIDCSAFVQKLYKEVYNKIIPRTCKHQHLDSERVDLSDIKIGDIIFFSSRVSPSGWHVGVYIGNDEFVHSANYKDGVKISCLFDYLKIFKGLGRY